MYLPTVGLFLGAAQTVVLALRDKGIPASIAGEAVPLKNGIHVTRAGKKQKLEHPKTDPFWGKFEELLKK